MGILGSVFKNKGYVPRETWSAAPPVCTKPFSYPITNVFVTSVGSPNEKPIYYKDQCLRFLKELQKYQVYDVGLPDIAYNFYVGAEGKLYEGRGWNTMPSLTQEENPDNKQAFTICYIRDQPGNFQPTEPMIAQVRHTIERGIKEKIIHDFFDLYGITDGLDYPGHNIYKSDKI